MVSFAKGHGTQNDFLIFPDDLVSIDLTESLVAAVCDRQRGLGADGVLRVARAGKLVDAGVLAALPEGVKADDWFMDYRNSDGSIAEMCGNGVRVFAHYIAAIHSPDSVVDGTLRVGTRAGLRAVSIDELSRRHAVVGVDMGQPEVLGLATAFIGSGNNAQKFAGIGVDVGNPHLACVMPGLNAAALAELELEAAGSVVKPVRADEAMFPNGLNVEIVTPLDASDSVSMRVIERGVGETRSCGTGTVAAAIAALADAGRTEGVVTVKVPGGVVTVDVHKASNADGDFSATLTGPSVIHTLGDIELEAL
ncbi:diaminopimelate epimerase [Corynebacterium amycolatum]|uniref:diaminopimelate epimerase n=1 Tax=Corynebacterium TaxID=1716 RepID=UPI0008A18899|nr:MULTISPECIES: diaminopimelate epimerase [unclassified Corynebacterium]MBC6792272.1 diaminopimelate epimerase [Corynebacterium sp. LK26]MDU3111617.1 diaminopimelate epimerase [Corynebacterium sp.]OFL70720.1 diaminopimelate epimerase [Corynebacterium sp. HMSC077C02]OFN37232.1 diaminopimelate epimerase [Corynebacterium sp. HMSC077G07]